MRNNDIVEAGVKVVEGVFDAFDSMMYILIGLAVALVGCIGCLVYLLVF